MTQQNQKQPKLQAPDQPIQEPEIQETPEQPKAEPEIQKPEPEKLPEQPKTEPEKKEAAPPKLPLSVGARGVEVRTLEDLWRLASYVFKSPMKPKGFDNVESVLVAMQFGMELGLSPIQGLQNVGIINGRPGLFGDAVPALVEQSGKKALLLEASSARVWLKKNPEYLAELPGGKLAEGTFYCIAQRKGDPFPNVRWFGDADVKTAGLLDKNESIHRRYPDRMKQMRARGFAVRDTWPDVTKGLYLMEELQDIVEAPDFETLPPDPGKSRTEKLADRLEKQKMLSSGVKETIETDSTTPAEVSS